MVATGGLFAPTIRHAHGVTYIICTNAVRDLPEGRKENFFIRTNDIWSGSWSDPVYFDFSGIDPSIFFDDDGKAYVQGCMPGSVIICFEIDLNTGKSLTKHLPIWSGWDKRFTEGPHIYKKDGWYYLLCAEGGTFDDHLVSMARSRTLWGPYEACNKNPIWTAHGTERYVQHTGHADLFQDTHGGWWAAMLGVRKRKHRFVLGRETFLTGVNWPEGDWPSARPVQLGVEDSLRISEKPRLEVLPGVDWVFLRDVNYGMYQINDKNVRVTASKIPLTSPDESPSFIGKRQRSLEGTCLVNISARSSPDRVQSKAGLALYKDEHRFIAVGIDFTSEKVSFEFINKAKHLTKSKTEDISLGEQDVVALKCSYTEMSYEFSFRTDPKGKWYTIGRVDTLDMSGYDYIGPIFGLFAVGEAGEVDFENFTLDINCVD